MKRIRLTVTDGPKQQNVDWSIMDEEIGASTTEAIVAVVMRSMEKHLWAMLKETDR